MTTDTKGAEQQLRALWDERCAALAAVEAGNFPAYAGTPGWREKDTLGRLEHRLNGLVRDVLPQLLAELDRLRAVRET